MPTQKSLDSVYMKTAYLNASLSKANRKKVGACLVTPIGTVIPSWNGTPQGADNNCEEIQSDGSLVTKSEVIHAELGCVLKCAKEGISVMGSTIYVTLSPCKQCSAMIKQAGITRVVFSEAYRDSAGIEYLKNNGIVVEQLL